MELQKIAKQLGYTLPYNAQIDSFSIDSRTLPANALFVAFRGAHVDGHDYIDAAIRAGARAIICEKKPSNSMSVPHFVVDDCQKALAQLAIWHRQSVHCPVIALTGSNGKTTVKEMIAGMLLPPSLATQGNLNNHLGVPLNVLKLNQAHRYAVFELGASAIGDIAYTAAMVQPDVSLINNIAPAHIAKFGSLTNIAQAKGEIYAALKPQGMAIVNQDDDFCDFWQATLATKQVMTFGIKHTADITAEHIEFNAQGCVRFKLITPLGAAWVNLQVAGLHSVYNALAAAACGVAVHLPLAHIAQSLSEFKGVQGRMMFYQGRKNTCIIDDTYNANLRSVLAGIDVLAQRSGQRILVLGDLGELGDWTKAHHEQIGLYAKQKGLDKLITYGSHSAYSSDAFGVEGYHYASQDTLIAALEQELSQATTLLVKGSRSAAMEKIIAPLIND